MRDVTEVFIFYFLLFIVCIHTSIARSNISLPSLISGFQLLDSTV